MDLINYFDCNCSFGRRMIVHPGSFYKLADLKEAMQRYGIGRALVYHSFALGHVPTLGNEKLLAEIKDDPAFVPAWVVMPHHTGEFDEPEVLVEKMREHNIKIVRIFPEVDSGHRYSLSSWNCGELFSTLEKYQIPVIMKLPSFDEVYELTNTYPKLKIILTGVNYRADRDLYPMLKRTGNIFIETSSYKVHNGIEEICERFGAERLIFGSDMPVSSGAAAVSMINYARISDEEKEMIAYKNLENLLEGVQL